MHHIELLHLGVRLFIVVIALTYVFIREFCPNAFTLDALFVRKGKP